MADKVAKPQRVTKSDAMKQLQRQKRDFAVQPSAFNSSRWSSRLVSSHFMTSEESQEEAADRLLIQDASKGIGGIEFPAEELAKIIRGWMAQDE